MKIDERRVMTNSIAHIQENVKRRLHSPGKQTTAASSTPMDRGIL